ncbi:hypothetical protein [Phycicoccus avicenniae]|uniref:hypothetical protein n=1 Tax=Phycicoccus avicenniae TaxID=2828860 RepID=UPI003D2BE6BE
MQGDSMQGTTRAERRRQDEKGSRRQARRSERRRRRSRSRTSLPNVVAEPSRTELLLVEDKASRSGRRASELALRGRRRRRTAGTLVAAATLALAGIGGATWAGLVPADLGSAAMRLVGADAPGAGTARSAETTDPAPASVTPSAPSAAASAPAAETADERLLSTVDHCRALSRGELDVSSAGYRSLVVSAGSADLDAWCADLTGDAARTQS